MTTTNYYYYYHHQYNNYYYYFQYMAITATPVTLETILSHVSCTCFVSQPSTTEIG